MNLEEQDEDYPAIEKEVSCEQCGKVVKLDDAILHGHFHFCSGDCVRRCVGA